MNQPERHHPRLPDVRRVISRPDDEDVDRHADDRSSAKLQRHTSGSEESIALVTVLVSIAGLRHARRAGPPRGRCPLQSPLIPLNILVLGDTSGGNPGRNAPGASATSTRFAAAESRRRSPAHPHRGQDRVRPRRARVHAGSCRWPPINVTSPGRGGEGRRDPV